MITAGDVLDHPITGETIVFRTTARDSGGELCQVELVARPGAFVAAEHLHPRQEERFAVIAGTLRGRIAGHDFSIGPGEQLVVPARTPHIWWNAGADELHVLVEVRPALRIESFFESFFGLAQDGKVHQKTGLPNPFQLAVLMDAFQQELVLARPPRPVQKLLLGVLAPLGRMLGYRAPYPYPHARHAAQAEAGAR